MKYAFNLENYIYILFTGKRLRGLKSDRLLKKQEEKIECILKVLKIMIRMSEFNLHELIHIFYYIFLNL